jgi:outer membrane protein OmpA-like peptidoglycan-associated protein
MKFCFSFLVFITSAYCISQQNLNGLWQGIAVENDDSLSKANIIYLDIQIVTDSITGNCIQQTYEGDYFCIKTIEGKISKGELIISQSKPSIENRIDAFQWIPIKMVLSYNDSTGYLSGTYEGVKLPVSPGKIILYRSKEKYSNKAYQTLSKLWYTKFIKDLQNGYNAPEIQAKERKNFKFQPIYFDYDEAIIKPEYQDFLLKMIRVVNSHSDLRIKVTGHTDSDGSEAYNIELSRRRAQAIIDFFVKFGIEEDRIEIDFKGESNPIDSNSTKEGKQKNRRVDFSFI